MVGVKFDNGYVKNDNGYVKNDNLTILILYLLKLYLPKPPAFRSLMQP